MTEEFARPSHEQVHPAGVEIKGRQSSYVDIHDINAEARPHVDINDSLRGLPAGTHMDKEGVISHEHAQDTPSGRKVEE